jgi:hypothetical protein
MRLLRVTAMIAAIGGLGAALTIYLRRPSEPDAESSAPQSDRIDEVGRESFPASDPPGWTLGEERDLI